MKIVERNMVGKKSQEVCEDGIVVTDDFIAVIDGSTSKTPTHLSPDMKNGRYAMVLISEFIRERLKAEASVDDFCQALIGGKLYENNKPFEEEIAARRASLIRQGMPPADARKAIEPLLIQAMLDGQNTHYAVIDGFPIYREGVKVIFPAIGEIVLASDGYPFLKPTPCL